MPQLLRVLLACAAVAVVAASSGPSRAQAAEAVDVELILAVDVSLSMSPTELEIQRRGYASAFKSKEVVDAITDGAHGKIAVTYVEWAGESTQRVVVPWTVLSNATDASRFADQLSSVPPNSARRTSISGALSFALDLFAESEFSSPKRVIDVSGDGPNNQGAPVNVTRDRVVEQGVVINGLPLMTAGGFSSLYDLKNLDHYYRDCVIGGPGAFMVPVNDWEQFPAAVRRKLVLELADAGSAIPAVAHPGELAVVMVQDKTGKTDCLAGEKIWRDRSLMWQRN